MKHRLLNNIFSAAGQTFIQTVILLLLYRYLVNSIGVEQMGVWSIVLAAVSAARISELGFGGSIIKYVAAHFAKGDDKAAAHALQTAAISVCALFAIMAAITYPLLLMALPHVLPAASLDAGRMILPYGFASLWLTSISSIWMNSLDACKKTGRRAGIMIFGSFLFFLLAVVGVKFYGLVGLAGAQVAQGLFLVIAGWVFMRRVIKSLPKLPKQWNFLQFREMLGYGINFQISAFVAFLFEPTTKILMGRYGGLSAAGYFEMAQRMVVNLRALLVESNRVIVPVYAAMGSYEIDAPVLYVRHARNLLFVVIPVFAAFLAMTPAICEVWVGDFRPQFVIMSVWLTFAWFLNTVSAPAYFAYLGQGRLLSITVGHIVMGAMNILAGFFLGKYFGWHGVLAAFVCSLVLGSIIPVWAYHIEHRIKSFQVFSTPDMISAGVCFGSALITLIIYCSTIDLYTVDKWVRVSVSSIMMFMVSAATIWCHPLRKHIIKMGTSSFLSGSPTKVRTTFIRE